jgi:tetratricopeptide (TPR) repeat protein
MRPAVAAACAGILHCLGVLSGTASFAIIAVAPAAAQRGDLNAILKRTDELYRAGNYPAALIEAQKFETGMKALFGTNHANYAIALNKLADVYRAQGNYADAEVRYKRALAIREEKLGADHAAVAVTLGNLANVYQDQGKYAEAEALYKRSLEINEKRLGKGHLEVATTLNNLASAYENQGKYADAEAHYKRALPIYEEKLGRDHPNVAVTFNNLGHLYMEQEKYADAEAHYKRALAIKEKTLGADHPDVANNIRNLGSVYKDQGKYAEAESLFRRALAIDEEKLGKDHPDVAITLNDLALVYKDQGKYAEAESLFRRALAIDEEKLGKDHPFVAADLNNLAFLYKAQGKYAEAEALDKRALAIDEERLGKDHPDVAIALINLVSVYKSQAKYADALVYSREASAAIIAHAQIEGAGAQQTSSAKGLVAQRAGFFRAQIGILYAAGRQGIEPQAALAREGFEIAQWAVQSSAAVALAQMAVRQAMGESALAQVVRERQDLERRWRGADQRLSAAVIGGDVKLASELRRELSGVDSRFADIDARLRRDFPDYAELSNPKRLSVAAAQALLGADEALLFWLDNNKESYVFALTRESFEWKSIPLGSEALAQMVAAFRRGLDVDALLRGLERVECTQAEADRRGLSRMQCDQVLAKQCAQAAAEGRGLVRVECNQVPESRRNLFDLGIAHELYDALIGPVEAPIRDKRHLLVVPSGALTALPFHLLVTEKPAVAVPQVKTPRDLAAYRDAAWLLKQHAVSVLPSVASLQALRVFAHKEQGAKPLVGFGDPVFNAEEEIRPGTQERSAAPRFFATARSSAAVSGRRGSELSMAASICARMRARPLSSARRCLSTAWSISPPMVSSPATSRVWPSPRSRSRYRRSRAISTTAS